MKASAKANPNFALVKYWGKRDEKLKLPQNSSISLTVSDFFTHTTIEFSEKYERDELVLNKKKYLPKNKEYENIKEFLNQARKISGTSLRAKVVSKNNFPTSAGFASSASGFSALATAVNQALSLKLGKKGLSILARMGSGSASRSIFSGFSEWKKGKKKDGSDCFAVQLKDNNYWNDIRIIACIISKKKKSIKSRKAMRETVKTSPMYGCWLENIENDLEKTRHAIEKKDFSLLGKTAEHNCLKMHSLMWTTIPPIIYQEPKTIEIIKKVFEMRDNGLECYFTMDAGPQVKILCLRRSVPAIIENILGIAKERFVLKPGRGARVSQNHLF
ncbi:diphosphomevalonate decarboxylase [Candidatus Woesearchaeota archaeon]|nr:diphosphomevalonate decarboxylase [Candidatus Woesearchaeota archaeon]